jgi:hypothetical protein
LLTPGNPVHELAANRRTCYERPEGIVLGNLLEDTANYWHQMTLWLPGCILGSKWLCWVE